jgi:putative membrane protein
MKGSAIALSIAMAMVCGSAFAAAAKADSEFAKKAAQGGMAEVKLGNLAASQGADPKIKEFGQRMITDHSKANDALQAAAKEENISLPEQPSKQQQAEADRLAKLHGAAFDKAYAKLMLEDHKKDVAEFKKEANSGKDSAVKSFASATLPKLEEHLRMAPDLPGNGSKNE